MKDKEKMELNSSLQQLEYTLRHLMCFGISDHVKKVQMGLAIEDFMRDKADKLSEEELAHILTSTEEMVRMFIEYLMKRGLVEVTDEPDH